MVSIIRDGMHRALRQRKSQSAMEFLTTYAWAIAIIAVVIGALYQLGVFSAGTFAPRASPGSCVVYRPSGPYSTTLMALQGTCTGTLPQFVASFVSASSQKVTMGALGTTNDVSITAWVYFTSFPTAPVTAGVAGIGSNGVVGDGFDLEICGAGYVNVHIQSQGGQCATGVPQISLNTWAFVAATETGGTVTVYVRTTTGTYATGVATSRSSQPLAIGYDPLCCSNGYANARIANVQIYNTSLSANEVQALYRKGIGGAPLVLQNLVGWWPLNGNANDYSGDNNNGVPTSMSYVSQWLSGYTPP